MDNSKLIETLKCISREYIITNSFDSVIMAYIVYKLDNLIIHHKNKPKNPIWEEVDRYKLSMTEIKSLIKKYKEDVKKLDKSVSVNNLNKKKQLLKDKFKDLISETEKKYKLDIISIIYTFANAINDSDGFNLLLMRRDCNNEPICNGHKNNLPFLINFIVDILENKLMDLSNSDFKKLDKKTIISFIENIIVELTRGNYRIGFDNLFKNEKLLVYLANKKLHINKNSISIHTIYELSNCNITGFLFETFCDTVNGLIAECDTNLDTLSNDQTLVINSFGEPFYEDKYIRVFRADTKEQSVLYGTGYGFCISTTTGFNYFNKYRFTKMGSCGYETTIHFVFFKNKEFQNEQGMFNSGVEKGIFDKWNMCIIDLCYEDEQEKNQVWYYTTSKNNGTHRTVPDEIKVSCKELEIITSNQLKTNRSKYNNSLVEAFKSGKAFVTKPYTDSELLLKDYSSEMGYTKEITLNTVFKKPKRTLKTVLDDVKSGEIFADMLLTNMNEYNLSNEVIKYIYTKIDHSKTSGDSIIGRKKYDIKKKNYTSIHEALSEADNFRKINTAIGKQETSKTKEFILKYIETLKKEEELNKNNDEPELIH